MKTLHHIIFVTLFFYSTLAVGQKKNYFQFSIGEGISIHGKTYPVQGTPSIFDVQERTSTTKIASQWHLDIAYKYAPFVHHNFVLGLGLIYGNENVNLKVIRNSVVTYYYYNGHYINKHLYLGYLLNPFKKSDICFETGIMYATKTPLDYISYYLKNDTIIYQKKYIANEKLLCIFTTKYSLGGNFYPYFRISKIICSKDKIKIFFNSLIFLQSSYVLGEAFKAKKSLCFQISIII